VKSFEGDVKINNGILEEHEFKMNRTQRNIFHILQTNTKIEVGSSNRLQNRLRSRNVLTFWEN